MARREKGNVLDVFSCTTGLSEKGCLCGVALPLPLPLAPLLCHCCRAARLWAVLDRVIRPTGAVCGCTGDDNGKDDDVVVDGLGGPLPACGEEPSKSRALRAVMISVSSCMLCDCLLTVEY